MAADLSAMTDTTFCLTHNREHQAGEQPRRCRQCDTPTIRYDGRCLAHARCLEIAWFTPEHIERLAAELTPR